MITMMSFDVLFLMNGVAFILSASFVLSVTLPRRKDTSHGESFWTRVTKGTRIYLKTPRLKGLLALTMVVSSAGPCTPERNRIKKCCRRWVSIKLTPVRPFINSKRANLRAKKVI
jgi:hypothetical protein